MCCPRDVAPRLPATFIRPVRPAWLLEILAQVFITLPSAQQNIAPGEWQFMVTMRGYEAARSMSSILGQTAPVGPSHSLFGKAICIISATIASVSRAISVTEAPLLADWCADAASDKPALVADLDDVFIIMPNGGTPGTPKGVMNICTSLAFKKDMIITGGFNVYPRTKAAFSSGLTINSGPTITIGHHG